VLLNELCCLLDLDCNADVSHSYRDVNQCVKTITNITCSLDYNLKIYET